MGWTADSPGRVVVFGLGGTIAMTPASTGGVAPTLTVDQLTAAVPGLAEVGIELVARDFRRLPGASLTFEDVSALAEAIGTEIAGGATGVVITQGTDTIEETAYALDLLYAHTAPVVVTGAMRHPALAGADGPANLLAAVQTAASPQLRGQGVVVVLADEIHAARRVRKTHSTSTATFASPNAGPLGYVVEGNPRLLNPLQVRPTVPAGGRPTPARVALVTVSFGDDGELLRGLGDRFDGVVVAGFGVGHVPVPWVEPLTALAARVPVILASRTGAGSTLTSTYGFAGSERDLLDRGLIGAGFLDPFKARVLLHVVLRVGADRVAVAAAFNVAGGTADPATWPWPATDDAAPNIH
jgi:L-asparaginase